MRPAVNSVKAEQMGLFRDNGKPRWRRSETSEDELNRLELLKGVDEASCGTSDTNKLRPSRRRPSKNDVDSDCEG